MNSREEKIKKIMDDFYNNEDFEFDNYFVKIDKNYNSNKIINISDKEKQIKLLKQLQEVLCEFNFCSSLFYEYSEKIKILKKQIGEN